MPWPHNTLDNTKHHDSGMIFCTPKAMSVRGLYIEARHLMANVAWAYPHDLKSYRFPNIRLPEAIFTTRVHLMVNWTGDYEGV